MRGPKTTLSLYIRKETSDGMGSGGSASASTLGTVTGVLRTLSGHERYAAGTEMVIRTHRFYCDYTSDLDDTRSKYFKWGSKYLDIEAANNVGQMGIYQQVDLKERQ